MMVSLLASPRVARAASTLDIDVGYGTGTVAAQAFGPGAATVVVGDSVRFTITSDEVHTVTFGDGPANMPPANWPVSGWTAPAGPPPWEFGSVQYDGTGFLNTGIAVKGSTATVEFTEAGTFAYLCAIHPGMAGTVTVVDSGPATTQAEADADANATEQALLGAVDGLRSDRLDAVSTDDNGDGTATLHAFADATTRPGPRPGGGSGYLELLEFLPSRIAIKQGDTISWTASAVHTVTFLPEGDTVADHDAFTTPPSGDGTDYDGTGLANSGLFNAGPGSPASFSLTFSKEGTYPFYCLLHAELGQIGLSWWGCHPLTRSPARSLRTEEGTCPGRSAWHSCSSRPSGPGRGSSVPGGAASTPDHGQPHRRSEMSRRCRAFGPARRLFRASGLALRTGVRAPTGPCPKYVPDVNAGDVGCRRGLPTMPNDDGRARVSRIATGHWHPDVATVAPVGVWQHGRARQGDGTILPAGRRPSGRGRGRHRRSPISGTLR